MIDKTKELLNEFKSIKTAYNKAKVTYAEDLILLLNESIKQILSKSTKIKSIGWTQYTPYFNDGDLCEFRVEEVRYINDEDSDTVEWFVDKFTLKENDNLLPTLDIEESKLFLECADLIESIDEDLMFNMYGDHAKITISKNGELTIDEYEHD